MKYPASRHAGISRFTRRLLARDGLAVAECDVCHVRRLVDAVAGTCERCDVWTALLIEVLRRGGGTYRRGYRVGGRKKVVVGLDGVESGT